MSITSGQADGLVKAALAAARAKSAQPLAVVVVDAGGHPAAFLREDGASLFRFPIAQAKAVGALGMGMDTRDIAVRAAGNPAFFTTVAIATDGKLALSPGGVIVRDAAGTILGAVGISGDTGDCDEACAFEAIDAVGLTHGARV